MRAFFGFFNDYDGFLWKISKGLEWTAAESKRSKAKFNYDWRKISYLFLKEGVKRRTKVLRRLRLICPDVGWWNRYYEVLLFSGIVASFSRKHIHFEIGKNLRAMYHKMPHKEASKFTYGSDFSVFSLWKNFFETKKKTSRDFNFAVKTQCKFYTFVVTSFSKQRIKICNLVSSIVEKQLWKIKALQLTHYRFVLLARTLINDVKGWRLMKLR